MGYRVLDHTADFMVEVSAPTKKALFEEAAKALFGAVLTDLETIRPVGFRRIHVSARDQDELLVTWLSELLYLHESAQWLFCRFEVERLETCELEAKVFGEPFDPGRHAIVREVKAVTYHQLGIERVNGSFRTRIVFDL